MTFCFQKPVGNGRYVGIWGIVVTKVTRIASTVMLAYLGSTAIARAQDVAPPAAAAGQRSEVSVTAER
jgi:hypothetical protein